MLLRLLRRIIVLAILFLLVYAIWYRVDADSAKQARERVAEIELPWFDTQEDEDTTTENTNSQETDDEPLQDDTTVVDEDVTTDTKAPVSTFDREAYDEQYEGGTPNDAATSSPSNPEPYRTAQLDDTPEELSKQDEEDISAFVEGMIGE